MDGGGVSCWKSSGEGEVERQGELSRVGVIGLGERSASENNRGEVGTGEKRRRRRSGALLSEER